MKHETLHRFSFFASVKSFIASLLQFFAIINNSSLHRFPNLPPLPYRFNEKNINA
jgi:hypothetical protein